MYESSFGYAYEYNNWVMLTARIVVNNKRSSIKGIEKMFITSFIFITFRACFLAVCRFVTFYRIYTDYPIFYSSSLICRSNVVENRFINRLLADD